MSSPPANRPLESNDAVTTPDHPQMAPPPNRQAPGMAGYIRQVQHISPIARFPTPNISINQDSEAESEQQIAEPFTTARRRHMSVNPASATAQQAVQPSRTDRIYVGQPAVSALQQTTQSSSAVCSPQTLLQSTVPASQPATQRSAAARNPRTLRQPTAPASQHRRKRPRVDFTEGQPDTFNPPSPEPEPESESSPECGSSPDSVYDPDSSSAPPLSPRYQLPPSAQPPPSHAARFMARQQQESSPAQVRLQRLQQQPSRRPQPLQIASQPAYTWHSFQVTSMFVNCIVLSLLMILVPPEDPEPPLPPTVPSTTSRDSDFTSYDVDKLRTAAGKLSGSSLNLLDSNAMQFRTAMLKSLRAMFLCSFDATC